VKRLKMAIAALVLGSALAGFNVDGVPMPV
jgi:hypothetical protein